MKKKSPIKFVQPDQLETLEHYVYALVEGMLTLSTLEKFHLVAIKKGILNDDETEASTTMSWELRRTISLYRQAAEMIMERTNMTSAEVIQYVNENIIQTKGKNG